ncbi:MAG: DHH family phosphoesterase [Oscillospiraceae bacterium]|nr:DHH family phosphoesterase [Oscillospiraceae bacterium]
MRSLTRAETAAYLLGRNGFAIVTHRRPDGDTLGSAAALCRALRSIGKSAHVLYNPEVTVKYAHLLEGISKPAAQPGDVVISVDVASPGMLPAAFSHLLGHIDLRIDHHRSSESFTDFELVDPQAAACGQIIYDIMTEMGVHLDNPMANALYTAISTDTGCFRYANTQSRTFEVAAACAAVSKDLPMLNQALFETNSLKRLKLQGWIIEHLQFLADGKIAICALPLAVEKAMELSEDDMENISGFPRSIEGVKIAATLRQQEDGIVKLSVRALPEYDASAVCAVFGGGGHRGAAGASMDMTMEEAVEAVINAMPKL